MQKMKERYDREGVQNVEDESGMGRTPLSREYTDEKFDFNASDAPKYERTQVNMGGSGP